MLDVMNIVSIELFQFWDNGFHDVLDRIVATFLVVSEPDYVFYHLEHELAQSNDAIKFNMVLNLFTSRLPSKRIHDTLHHLNLLYIILIFNVFVRLDPSHKYFLVFENAVLG